MENTFAFNFDVNTFHNEEVQEPEVAPETYTDNVYTTDFKMEEKRLKQKSLSQHQSRNLQTALAVPKKE